MYLFLYEPNKPKWHWDIKKSQPPSLSFLFFVQIGVVPIWNSFVSQYDLYHHQETRRGEGLVVGIWEVNFFFFLLMFENDVETASSFSLNDGVLTLQMHSPILSFSFLNPYFSIFSSALFGFQESGVGLIWIVFSFYVLIAKKMKEKEVKFLIYVWFFFWNHVLIFFSWTLFSFRESGLGLIWIIFLSSSWFMFGLPRTRILFFKPMFWFFLFGSNWFSRKWSMCNLDCDFFLFLGFYLVGQQEIERKWTLCSFFFLHLSLVYKKWEWSKAFSWFLFADCVHVI